MFTRKDLEEKQAKGLIRGFSGMIGENLKRSKYGAKKTVVDGNIFDSQKEANRYVQLRYRLRLGEITDLKLQVEFPLEVNGKKVASYIADFAYYEYGVYVVEDVKSVFTRRLPVYRLKKKLMASIYGITIKEV